MSVIFILIGISLVVATTFLFAFIWAVKTGQFEDFYTPSLRILFDEKPASETEDEQPINSAQNHTPPSVNKEGLNQKEIHGKV